MTCDFARERATSVGDSLSKSDGCYRTSSSPSLSARISVFRETDPYPARHFSFRSVHKGNRYQKSALLLSPRKCLLSRMNKTTQDLIYIYYISRSDAAELKVAGERLPDAFRGFRKTGRAEVEIHCEDLRISEHTSACRRRIPYHEREKRREFPRSITM